MGHQAYIQLGQVWRLPLGTRHITQHTAISPGPGKQEFYIDVKLLEVDPSARPARKVSQVFFGPPDPPGLSLGKSLRFWPESYWSPDESLPQV